MFCSECGKPVDKDAAFCAYCGTAIGIAPNRIVNNTVHSGCTTINIDRSAFIITLLSIGMIISSAFLDVFRLTFKCGYLKGNAILKVFNGSGYISNGETLNLDGAQYNSALFNIMFIIICLIAVMMIVFACTKKRYGVIICGLVSMIVLFAFFCVCCLSVSRSFELSFAFVPLEQELELMRLPGIGLVIDFVLSIVITIIGIRSLSET